MMRALVGNCLEMLLDRPFRARDHILRATSEDGLEWSKDHAFRYRYPVWHRDRMSYYVGRDGEGRLWFRSSIRDGAVWRTELRSPGRVLRLDAVGSIGGFSWVADRIYLARKGEGAPSAVIALDVKGAASRPVPLEWPDLDRHGVIEDVFVLPTKDGQLHAWLSLTREGRGTSIEHHCSGDGLLWRRQTFRIDGLGAYANNPCVIEAAAGQWRMYLRTGDRPAFGNVIRSAVSTDLDTWRLETGIRISPGGRWDTHGAAFPFVERTDGVGFVMYYTGYWGRCSEGEVAARYWSSLGRVEGVAT